MVAKILIDLAHNERVTSFPDDIFDPTAVIFSFNTPTSLLDDVAELKQYDMILLGNPIPRKDPKDPLFTKAEITALKKYVKEGGAIFLAVGSRGDYNFPASQGSLQALSELTGVTRFPHGILMNRNSKYHIDKSYNLRIAQVEKTAILNTKKIDEAILLSKCSYCELNPEDPPEVFLIAPPETGFYDYNTEKTRKVAELPLGVVKTVQKGKVCTLACSKILIDDEEIGIKMGGNQELIKAIFTWLLKKN
jgi:hypothetical protein